MLHFTIRHKQHFLLKHGTLPEFSHLLVENDLYRSFTFWFILSSECRYVFILLLIFFWHQSYHSFDDVNSLSVALVIVCEVYLLMFQSMFAEHFQIALVVACCLLQLQNYDYSQFDNIYIHSARDSYRCNSVLLLERDKKFNLKASLKKYLQNDSINWYHAYNRLNNIILTTCIIHNKYIYIFYTCSYLKGLLAGCPV
ncbi:hypothetical protein AGLY_015245 [Aphis glycines]|uniref:Uncharacterized protein n=1 Tax=Aphis glycines TaxID=307491 RepID=A0A6G0T0P2_APHGL|nr:hypothetical protein AGLY_015245 [Aphis glycines]